MGRYNRERYQNRRVEGKVQEMKDSVHTLKTTPTRMGLTGRKYLGKLTQTVGLLVLCMQALEIRILLTHLPPHVAASQMTSSLPNAANK